MGYNVNRKVFTLQWDDTTEYPDMEVKIKSVPTGKFLQIIRGAAVMSEFDKTEVDLRMAAKLAKELNSMLRTLGSALVEWNLEDEGEPIPCVFSQCRESRKPIRDDFCADHKDSEDECEPVGLMGLELELIQAIIEEWSSQMAGVDNPLPSDSPSGENIPALHFPMEPLSPSRLS